MDTREHEFPDDLTVEDEIPETHRPLKKKPTTQDIVIRATAIVVGLFVIVWALFHFLINPWALDYFMAHPQTQAEIQHENLLAKYDIASLETSTKSAGKGYGGLPASVSYYVVDGVMRDCKITGSTEDPILTCIGWEPPLRSAVPSDTAAPGETPTVTETALP